MNGDRESSVSQFLVIDKAEELQFQLDEFRHDTSLQVRKIRDEVASVRKTVQYCIAVSLPLIIGWVLFIGSKVTESRTFEQYVVIVNIGIFLGILLHDFLPAFTAFQSTAETIENSTIVFNDILKDGNQDNKERNEQITESIENAHKSSEIIPNDLHTYE